MPWRSRAQARRCRSRISRRVRPPSPRRPPRPLARSPRRRVLRRRCPRNPRLRVRSLRPGPRNVRCRRRSSVRRHPRRRRPPWPSNVRPHLRPSRPPRPHSARNGLLADVPPWEDDQVPYGDMDAPMPEDELLNAPAGLARSAQPHPTGAPRPAARPQAAPVAAQRPAPPQVGMPQPQACAAPRGLRAACCAFLGPAGSCAAPSGVRGPAGAFLRGRSANPRRAAGRAAGGLRRRRDVRRSQGIAHIRARARYNAMV